jgi:hypothetical protein
MQMAWQMPQQAESFFSFSETRSSMRCRIAARSAAARRRHVSRHGKPRPCDAARRRFTPVTVHRASNTGFISIGRALCAVAQRAGGVSSTSLRTRLLQAHPARSV